MRAACSHCINGYYDTVPVVPISCFGNRERRERLGTAIEKYRFSQIGCSGTVAPEARKTAAFPFPVTVIERGVSGHPLSLQTTGRAKDSDHAEREHRNEPHFDPPASAPSGTASIVGRIGPVARNAPAWREPLAAAGARSPRASILRTDRTDLNSPGCARRVSVKRGRWTLKPRPVERHDLSRATGMGAASLQNGAPLK